MRKTLPIGVLAIVVLGALAVVSVGFGKSARVVHRAPDGKALASARAHIGALRRALASANDAMPSAVAQGPLMSDGVVDAASAREVRRLGRQVWLADSSDGRSVCEVTPGALACPPVAQLVQQGVSPALVVRTGEPVHVSGIAIDGVTSVDVVLRSGAIETVPVTSNLFTLDLPEIPAALRWQGPNGAETYQFPPGPPR